MTTIKKLRLIFQNQLTDLQRVEHFFITEPHRTNIKNSWICKQYSTTKIRTWEMMSRFLPLEQGKLREIPSLIQKPPASTWYRTGFWLSTDHSSSTNFQGYTKRFDHFILMFAYPWSFGSSEPSSQSFAPQQGRRGWSCNVIYKCQVVHMEYMVS
jgi:hypothetical protein